jgi:glycosyltransferase involved in cell wall biosynthesis
VLIPIAIDPPVSILSKAEARQILGLEPQERCIGVVGRLEEGKGIEILIEAMKYMSYGTRLLIVGDGFKKEQYEALVREHSLEGQVLFLGWKEDVWTLLPAFDVFVLPSVHSEGLPNVILEAFYCSVPVVASRIGGIPDIIYDGVNGRLVPPGDAIAIARVVEEVLANKSVAEQLALEARRLVLKEHLLEKELAGYRVLFEQIGCRSSVHTLKSPRDSV